MLPQLKFCMEMIKKVWYTGSVLVCNIPNNSIQMAGTPRRQTMRATLQKTWAGVRCGTALLILLAIFAGMVPARADTVGGYGRVEDATGQTQETLAAMALEKRTGTDEDLQDIRIRQDGQIYGRGVSDEPSGAEPDYIGLVGYAAMANDGSVSLETEGIGFPWAVPAYLLYSKRWYYTQPLQHKTGVLVVRQMLKEAGAGRYTGRLKIIRLDSGEICWMDVENFVTVPYWFYPARRAVKYGNTVAAYRCRGKRSPTDDDGKPVKVADDTDVLIPGNGVWDRRPPEGSRMIPGIVYEEKITEKDGKEIREVVSSVLLFPEEDLTMIY